MFYTAQALVRLGFTIEIVAPEFDVSQTSSGISWTAINEPRSIFNKLRLLVYLSIRVLLEKDRYFISEVPVFSVFSYNLVFLIHDAKFASPHKRRGGYALWLLFFLAARSRSRFMTVSNSERLSIARALKIHSDRISVVANGIDNAYFNAISKKQSREWDILYVSNFAEHKNHEFIIRVASKAGFRTIFVGNDLGTKSRVLEMAECHSVQLKILSDLSEQELIDVYDSVKCFVFPSLLEGFGMPFLEARARGLPVVANSLPVFSELSAVFGGKLVSVLGENSESNWASAIRKEIKTATYKTPRSLNSYSWDSVGARLISELNN
jgi:glycosyltransferase involved in cell wall biosynthesis